MLLHVTGFPPPPLFFWPHPMAYRNLVLQPGVEPQPLAVEAWSPNHGTTREFPGFPFKAALYSVVKCICNILSICPSVDVHLGCFHLLAIEK